MIDEHRSRRSTVLEVAVAARTNLRRRHNRCERPRWSDATSERSTSVALKMRPPSVETGAASWTSTSRRSRIDRDIAETVAAAPSSTVNVDDSRWPHRRSSRRRRNDPEIGKAVLHIEAPDQLEIGLEPSGSSTSDASSSSRVRLASTSSIAQPASEKTLLPTKLIDLMPVQLPSLMVKTTSERPFAQRRDLRPLTDDGAEPARR